MLMTFRKSRFCGDDWSRLRCFSKYLHFQQDQTIFAQGDPIHEVSIIFQGSAQLIRHEGEDALQSRIVQFLCAGDIVSAAGLLGKLYHCTGAVALQASCLYSIQLKEWQQLCKQYPNFVYTILSNMLDQKERANRHVSILHARSARSKLVGLLMEMGEMYGHTEDSALKIDLTLTDTKLAKMLGLSRETISREINVLKRKNFIHRRGRYLFLLDLQGLNNLLR